ncbi:hypothetical protein SAMN05192566_0921 [Methylophilus rhizosphaerae]|uniref:Uncharacterized protein n=1 Tax=Methylophilus rhizosphaerae TaxID=492660 RepID=A0A1G9B2I8_9PROT|nr:hypothetical protein [Methylophilus rhizosphaerae]SDK33045.1 hypothetical protein SAMN05192566_0921 [Methylophilus rhizosphaerae]
MTFLSSQVQQIARIGANLELSPESNYLSSQVEQIIRIVKSREGHIRVHAGNYTSSQLEQFARIGGASVTIVV